MDLVREVCSAIHSVRKAAGYGPPAAVEGLVAHRDAARLEPFVDLIADEVNVKSVELETEPDSFATSSLVVVPAEIGPRLGPATQQVIAAVRGGEWQPTPDGRVLVAGVRLEPGEFSLRLVSRDPDSGRVIDGERGVVVLDTAPTPDLEAEGTARDLVRLVQQARRDADLVITDRIELTLAVPDDVAAVLAAWGGELRRQTLATSLAVSRPRSWGRRARRLRLDAASDQLPDGRGVTVYLRPVDTPAPGTN